MADHYATLGVERTCDAAAVKSAYRKLAMTHHPDKGGDAEAFRRIVEAFEVLRDPERRARYDAELRGQVPGVVDDDSAYRFGDLFEGAFQRKRPRDGPVHGADLTVELVIDAVERGFPTLVRIPQAVGHRDVVVDVPADIDDGVKLWVRRAGEPGRRGGVAGHLYVVVRVR